MTKKYIIESEELVLATTDYVKSDVLPGAVEPVLSLEPVEGSCYTIAEFDNLAAAKNEFARYHTPSVDADGFVVVVSLLSVDEDGEVEVLSTTADNADLVELCENAQYRTKARRCDPEAAEILGKLDCRNELLDGFTFFQLVEACSGAWDDLHSSDTYDRVAVVYSCPTYFSEVIESEDPDPNNALYVLRRGVTYEAFVKAVYSAHVKRYADEV